MPVVHVANLIRLANRGEPGDAAVRWSIFWAQHVELMAKHRDCASRLTLDRNCPVSALNSKAFVISSTV
jgi:hypothetical protein